MSIRPVVANVQINLGVPAPVTGILSQLQTAGFEAYVVGGCVRDTVLGRVPHDWDVTTSATPDEIVATFPKAKLTNRFGTVLVPSSAGGVIEVTTYRVDGQYTDHRRPDQVAFTRSLEEDLSRRDFTMNALAYADGVLVDHFDGVRDLRAGKLRTVGSAHQRFSEDALRMLRAARFVSQLGFKADPEILGAMTALKETLAYVSKERILGELEKILLTPKPSAALRILGATGCMEFIFPPLHETIGIVQTLKSGFDVFEHTLRTIDAVPNDHEHLRSLRWAALCHDVGKPKTASGGHFINHDIEGSFIAERALRKLTLDARTINLTKHLVRWHMFWFLGEWTPAAVRRFITKVGLENVPLLLDLRKADVRGGGSSDPRFYALDELERRIKLEIEAKHAFSLRDLALDGTDLMRELNLQPGRILKVLLTQLFEEVLENPSANTYEQLLARAHDILPTAQASLVGQSHG